MYRDNITEIAIIAKFVKGFCWICTCKWKSMNYPRLALAILTCSDSVTIFSATMKTFACFFTGSVMLESV